LNLQTSVAFLTLVVAGVMTILFAMKPDVFNPPIDFGVILVVDGAFVVSSGLSGRVPAESKRYYSLWGAAVTIVGLGFLFSEFFNPGQVAIYLVGILLILVGGIVWWSGRKQK
jgi:hypothetical protein